MKNWLNRVLFPKWIVIRSMTANWVIHSTWGEYDKKCYYELLYSEVRGTFRIKTGGYSPKKHLAYPVAVNLFMEVIKKK